MKQLKELRVEKPVMRAILATVLIVIGFSLAGCGEQMAKIEDQQLRLQAMVEANTEQIAVITARIEQNQEALQAGLEDLRSTVRQVEAQTTSLDQSTKRLAAEQLKMQDAAKNSSRQITAEITALEQNQSELKAGIENVQNDARMRASDIASDVKAVAAEQARLSEKVQNNSSQLADNAAMIEQDRQQWAGTLEGLQENIQQVTVQMNSLGEDLSKLQETLQQNVRELVAMIESAGREQTNFREKTQATIRTLNDALNAVKQNQGKLQTQIKDVQNKAETIGRNVPEALAKSSDELAHLDVKERAEIADVKASSSSPPTEANSVE